MTTTGGHRAMIGAFGAYAAIGVTESRAEDFLTDLGDVLQIALPAAGGTATLFEGDPEFNGTWQWAKTTGMALGTMGVIKATVDKTRPSNGGHSFPSGHTTGAFTGAAFIERRYGWKWGGPAYALAVLTGYSRIDADAHDIWDVICGAAVGTMSAYIFTEPLEVGSHHVSIRPDVNDGYFGLKFSLLDGKSNSNRDSLRQRRFSSQYSREGGWRGRNIQTWTGTDPTEIVSSFEFRMGFYDYSLNPNRNDTNITAYAPKVRGNWALNDSMMVGAEIGYVWNNQFPFDDDGFSDLELNYQWRFYKQDRSGPWCSHAGTLGLDLLVPTGSASKGTGSGSWMVRPKISGAWSPIAGLNLYPTLSYYQSLDTDSLVSETSVASLELMVEYKMENGVYIHWRPDFLYDFSAPPLQDEFVANHTFEIGAPLFDLGVFYARYELISNALYDISPPGPGGRPRFYDDAISVGYRSTF